MPIAKLLRTVFGIETADSEESTGSTSVTVEREPADEDENEAESEPDTEVSEPDPGVGADPGEPGVDTEAETDIQESDADTEAAPEGDTSTADSSDEPVDSVSGIGSAYAEGLEATGIETVGDLLAADPAEIAADSDLSEKRVSGWQDAAEGE